jgi:enoyl-CoA hydratase/carnithine racemase
VGCGLVPGGGGLERLPYLIGRARALEVIIGGEDFDADTAELYGWINRSIPDAELDEYVDRFAKRVASFEKSAIADAKRTIYKRLGMAKVEDFKETQQLFFGAIARPETQARLADLFKRGLQQEGEFELNMGSEIGPQ